MDEKVININKTSLISLMLCFILLFSIFAPVVNAATYEEPNIEEKLEELRNEAVQYEKENGVTGEVIDLSKGTMSSSNSESCQIVKKGNDYTITFNNLVAKKVILPADVADLEDLKEGDIKYTGKDRKTHITIVLKGENKIIGYGIEGYPVKGIKIEGEGNLEIKAISEPKVQKVNTKSGSDWVTKAEINYYVKAGLSVETGNQKYAEYLSSAKAYSDENSLVFAGTGSIKISSPSYYGIVNNGDIKFKGGNVKIESKKSAISGYGIYINPIEDSSEFDLELISGEKVFFDKPTFEGSNYIVMASKSTAESAELKSKSDVANSYSSYRYVNAKFVDEKNAPTITGTTLKEGGIYCSLPEVTVTDDTAIDSITINGSKLTWGFSVNSAKRKVFKVPASDNPEKEIVVTDVVGNKSKISFTAYNNHELSKPTRQEGLAPTCTNDGYHFITFNCKVCGMVINTQKVVDPALGHKFNAWEETADGRKHTCSVCGITETETVFPSLNTGSSSTKSATPKSSPSVSEAKPAASKSSPSVSEAKPSTSNSSSQASASKLSTAQSNSSVTTNKQAEVKSETTKKQTEVKKVNNSITASNSTKTYSSKAQSFSIGAKQKGDAKLTYSSNNKNVTVNSSGKVTIAKGFVGKATITITANATTKYNKATKQITVTVNKANNSITASNFTKTYSSKAQSFSIKAKQKGNAKLTYSSNNKNVKVNGSGKVTISKGFIGKATITITANANSGYNKAVKKITVTVNPPSVKLSKLSNSSSKKMTIKWNKSTVVTGYQIQYSTDKNFKKNVKTTTITNKNTTSKTISKLTKKKKYYVRIRTYKTVSGVKYYSGWSSSKNITIKK